MRYKIRPKNQLSIGKVEMLNALLRSSKRARRWQGEGRAGKEEKRASDVESKRDLCALHEMGGGVRGRCDPMNAASGGAVERNEGSDAAGRGGCDQVEVVREAGGERSQQERALNG